MSVQEKPCPQCGRPLKDHQWKTKISTGEKFPICQGEAQGNINKSTESGRTVTHPFIESLPPSSVSVDKINDFASQLGVPLGWAEKVIRLSTILKELTTERALRELLVFMGGTPLNFGILGEEPPRLSFDLDFNYREPAGITSLDMDAVMEKTHQTFMALLARLNYAGGDIKYESPFELGKYKIRYRTLSGIPSTLKIDICYSRRIPLLQGKKGGKSDRFIALRMLDNVEAKIPAPEELCAEKLAAFMKRKHTRDTFDAYHIAKEVEKGTLNRNLLRKCALVCILYQEIDPRKVNWNQVFEKIQFDSFLQDTLTEPHRITPQHFDQMKNEVKNFLKGLYSDFSRAEDQYFDNYFKNDEFSPRLIDPERELHAQLANQSEMRWLISKRKKKRKR